MESNPPDDGGWTKARGYRARQEELIDCDPDIATDLTKQDRRDIALLMKRHSSCPARAVAKLLVRPTLPNFGEAHLRENRDDLSRLQNWKVAHRSGNGDVLYFNEMGFELRLTVFKEHGDDLLQILLKLIKRRALRVSPLEARNEAHVQTGGRIALNHCRVCRRPCKTPKTRME